MRDHAADPGSESANNCGLFSYILSSQFAISFTGSLNVCADNSNVTSYRILRVKVTWEYPKDLCPWIHHPYMDRE